ncbi:MAG: outer membrane protein assembly factor BamC [Methylococcales bacterium]|nr:outer membrane protein assembly factor BamC [Methylococcales bacterium]
MKIKVYPLFLSALVLANLSACSYIKSLFPDKEKDYQYTTAIPPLILPADLKNTTIPGVIIAPAPVLAEAVTPVVTEPVAPVVEEPVPQTKVAPAPTVDESVVAPPLPPAAATNEAEQAAIPDSAITIERIKFDDGENRLRINVPFTKAWRIVGKALTRKSIEVTGRDPEARLYTIQYDPDEQAVADDSYWDEVKFVVLGIDNNDKTYWLKLEEQHQHTDIVVVDGDQKLLSDAASVKLLTLIETTIKTDLAQKK